MYLSLGEHLFFKLQQSDNVSNQETIVKITLSPRLFLFYVFIRKHKFKFYEKVKQWVSNCLSYSEKHWLNTFLSKDRGIGNTENSEIIYQLL